MEAGGWGGQMECCCRCVTLYLCESEASFLCVRCTAKEYGAYVSVQSLKIGKERRPVLCPPFPPLGFIHTQYTYLPLPPLYLTAEA
jgi:hypothetical protein